MGFVSPLGRWFQTCRSARASSGVANLVGRVVSNPRDFGVVILCDDDLRDEVRRRGAVALCFDDPVPGAELYQHEPFDGCWGTHRGLQVREDASEAHLGSECVLQVVGVVSQIRPSSGVDPQGDLFCGPLFRLVVTALIPVDQRQARTSQARN